MCGVSIKKMPMSFTIIKTWCLCLNKSKCSSWSLTCSSVHTYRIVERIPRHYAITCISTLTNQLFSLLQSALHLPSLPLQPYSDPRVTIRLKELLASWANEFKSDSRMKWVHTYRCRLSWAWHDDSYFLFSPPPHPPLYQWADSVCWPATPGWYQFCWTTAVYPISIHHQCCSCC